ncbi:hypothetical protein HAX54_018305 [Datura stramonium]|uniref:Terpene synthase metal-binding domain-containing protein n=1 Tax=Datura stramonium TaxID=4076 RepID=A0ABS8UNQ0_DATST|nr:hypothetical protein [Datura stramonium]
MDGENLLNDIRLFSIKNLKNLSTSNVGRFTTNNPLAWRVRWYDVRRYITAQRVIECNTNSMLLKLAKLNFNIIQAAHQKDLKDVIRWWRNLCIIEDLDFTRDRIVESFFYAVGIASEPQHGSMRKWLTKVIQLVLIIDDVYDIYGSLDDVQQFTCAIEKWDPNETKCLPKCMQICFRILRATMEEICVEIQQQKGGPSTLPYLKQGWVNFCKALLVEATWHHEGHIPTLKEYLDNGWISSSGSIFSSHVIYGLTNKINNETMDLCKNCQDIIYHTSVIIRLCNDQGGARERFVKQHTVVNVDFENREQQPTEISLTLRSLVSGSAVNSIVVPLEVTTSFIVVIANTTGCEVDFETRITVT